MAGDPNKITSFFKRKSTDAAEGDKEVSKKSTATAPTAPPRCKQLSFWLHDHIPQSLQLNTVLIALVRAALVSRCSH
jgi:hypothetical protein